MTPKKPAQWIVIALVAVALLSARDLARDAVLPGGKPAPESVELSRAVALVRDGAIVRVAVAGDRIEMVDRSGMLLTTRKEPDVSFLETLQRYGVTPEQISAVTIDVRPGSIWPEGSVILGLVLAGLVALGLLVLRPKLGWVAQGNPLLAFRKSGAREQSGGQNCLTFEDVAGAEDAKQELREVVEFLRSPNRFSALGARMPRGILLTGAPGTGKTLLARATAGEAGVPFFTCSGSEFVEMFVGVGAARIRDLFQGAKKSAPCIVFIDEIDAIGRKRNAGSSNEERDQTLNQVLVEMDGFEQSSAVVVMAATNRPDILDSALLRPGRFDRRIVVDSPDLKDRVAILRIHSRGKPLSPEVDLAQLARQTTGFSGADLENVMNEAALLAGRRHAERIGAVDLEEAVDRVLIGLARKSRVISEREKWITAYHEAGHALVARELRGVDPVQRISIIPRGRSGGHTRLLPMEDRQLWSKSQLDQAIAFILGGMVAEELEFGEMTTGSASDLGEATGIARKMVCVFGMSPELGPLALGSNEDAAWVGQLSDEMARTADEETRRLLEQGREVASRILRANHARLSLLAEKLVERETLQGDELTTLLDGVSVADQEDPGGDSAACRPGNPEPIPLSRISA